MAEFQVNQPGICSICGEEKEPEELSELHGQVACLDCIAKANVSKNIPLEQLAAANPTPQRRQTERKSRFIPVLFTFFILALLGAGVSYAWHIPPRNQILRTSLASLKAHGDALAPPPKLHE